MFTALRGHICLVVASTFLWACWPALAQHTPNETRAPEQRSQARGLLQKLIAEGRRELSQQLLAEIERARKQIKTFNKGFIIVGRVAVDDGDTDPRDVITQMPILEGGYFAGVVAGLNRPVGFRLQGYLPRDLELGAFGADQDLQTGDIIDVGLVHMSRLSPTDAATLKGRLEIEDVAHLQDVTLELHMTPDLINTPSNGYSPRPKWPETIKMVLRPSGEFSHAGLSPAKYDLFVNAPDHVKRLLPVALKRGEATDVGLITLERPKVIELSYMLAQGDSFFDTKIESAMLRGGDRWKVRDDTYGWDVEFHQVGGGIKFNYFYAPCQIADLGKQELEGLRALTREQVQWQNPRAVEVKDGHVYLIDQRTWDHLILVKVSVEGPQTRGPAKVK